MTLNALGNSFSLEKMMANIENPTENGPYKEENKIFFQKLNRGGLFAIVFPQPIYEGLIEIGQWGNKWNNGKPITTSDLAFARVPGKDLYYFLAVLADGSLLPFPLLLAAAGTPYKKKEMEAIILDNRKTLFATRILSFILWLHRTYGGQCVGIVEAGDGPHDKELAIEKAKKMINKKRPGDFEHKKMFRQSREIEIRKLAEFSIAKEI